MECNITHNKMNKLSTEMGNFSKRYKQPNRTDVKFDVDDFLDKIGETKIAINTVTSELVSLYDDLEDLTHGHHSAEEIEMFRDIISDCKDYFREATDFYNKISKFRDAKMFLEEIDAFFEAFEDFQELVEDVDSTFNRLVLNEDFVKITKHLEEL